jgi:hypothetical protein
MTVRATVLIETNDVALDEQGLIYLVDRDVGFDIVEYAP